jgi:kumamolisin
MAGRRIGALTVVLGALTAASACLLPSTPAVASTVPVPNVVAGAPPRGATHVESMPGSQRLRMSVVLPPSHQGELDQLLAAQADPSSPQYHRWLSPGQFATDFGPAPADVGAVVSWLRSAGITPHVSGFQASFTAPESTVAAAFGTSFTRFTVGGQDGYVPDSTPLLPSVLGPDMVASVMGMSSAGALASGNATSGSAAHDRGALAPRADGLTPCAQATNEAGTGYDTLDAEGAAYGIGSLLSAGENGAGQTIALFEVGQSSSLDIATYKSCFGLTNPFSVQTVDGGATPDAGGTFEADLDAEQVMTQAPQARVMSYEGPNTTQGNYDIWNAIVTADTAQVVSTSWAVCEPVASAAGAIPAFTTLFEQAASQGQSVFSAAGDSGAEGCFANNTSTLPEVSYPASDQWVTAAGGTTMGSTSANPAAQQTAWNVCQGNENGGCAVSNGGMGAGGGGLSRYEARSNYQPNLASWATAQSCGTACREVPDISSNAGIGMVIYANGAWTFAGGTSFSSPLVGGIVADAASACGRFGLFAPLLYGLYSDGSYGTAFNDVIGGDNDLTGSNSGNWAANSGYDMATGIGSPIASGLTCPSVTSVSPGAAGEQVTVTGLGLEHAAITFGGAAANVVSATATSATVVVPPGSGTVTVTATSPLGGASRTASFTYPPPPPPASHGYWLVGSDGGIFTFGSAIFYGSTGNIVLQRPVVGIVPTSDRGGYWLVASDGGVFAFGDAGFYGSVPGLGIHPAGSGAPHSLDAPIVGIVPSADNRGYFMVASDGGVFAFGDALFEGSCPGIGGCAGDAVAVMPDGTGNGYWLVTKSGAIYTFGDAPYYGAPGNNGHPVTSAVRTPDGKGYWILTGDGTVYNFGNAANYGSPGGTLIAYNPATAVFSTTDGGGYWVASGLGQVFPYGDAPNDGSMAGTRLNGEIIAATGW